MLGWQRDIKEKGSPFAFFALEADIPVKQFDIALDDIEPQPCSLYVDRVIGAEEAAKEVFLLSLGNTDAFIAYAGVQDIPFQLYFNVNSTPFIGVFDRIGKQVDKDVFQDFLIQKDVLFDVGVILVNGLPPF